MEKQSTDKIARMYKCFVVYFIMFMIFALIVYVVNPSWMPKECSGVGFVMMVFGAIGMLIDLKDWEDRKGENK